MHTLYMYIHEVTALGVLCCFALLFVDLPCFFLPSHVGLLWREQEAAVTYGSIDGGKNIGADPKFCELVSGHCPCLHTVRYTRVKFLTLGAHAQRGLQ